MTSDPRPVPPEAAPPRATTPEPRCLARNGEYVCTREAGHDTDRLPWDRRSPWHAGHLNGQSVVWQSAPAPLAAPVPESGTPTEDFAALITRVDETAQEYGIAVGREMDAKVQLQYESRLKLARIALDRALPAFTGRAMAETPAMSVVRYDNIRAMLDAEDDPRNPTAWKHVARELMAEIDVRGAALTERATRAETALADASVVADFVCGWWPGFEDALSWPDDADHPERHPVYAAASRILDADRAALPSDAPGEETAA